MFTIETFAFLRDLEANNNKEWFDANRDRYESHWKAPALAFIESIAPRMNALDPPLLAEAKLNRSLRRINRDVRFSTDKSPYNPRLHMLFWTEGKPNHTPGMHVVLHADGVGFGTGLYGLGPEQLARYRDMVADNVERIGLEKALTRAESVGCTLGEPDLARLPKGYEAEGRAADLLRYKSIVARTHGDPAPPEAIIGPEAVDWVMERTEALLPLMRWLTVI